MTIAFVANVGSRDIIVDGRSNLPKDSRTLGEMILANWDAYKADLRLPILVKALESVINKHGEVAAIVLFASDQRDQTYRHTDTLPFAHIVQRHMREKYGQWIDERLSIVTIGDNPSDYDSMMKFYGDALKPLVIYDRIYTAVTGGTPAMSFMLLWHGVEVLGERAQPLYVLQERAIPNALNIGQTLLLKTVRDDIRASLKLYQYPSVYQLLMTHQTLLKEAKQLPYTTIVALVEYARLRFNFNFDLAQSALLGAESGVADSVKAEIDTILNSISQRDERWLLREEIFSAELDLSNQAYKDALTNVFAFREGTLRLLALQQGVVLVDNKKLDETWLNSVPGLADYLREKNVDVTRTMTRLIYERILDFLSKKNTSVKTLAQRVKAFEPLATIRNDSTHNHAGVSEKSIQAAYKGGVTAIAPELRDLYEAITNQPVGQNPFDVVNTLIQRLIEEAS